MSRINKKDIMKIINDTGASDEEVLRKIANLLRANGVSEEKINKNVEIVLKDVSIRKLVEHQSMDQTAANLKRVEKLIEKHKAKVKGK